METVPVATDLVAPPYGARLWVWAGSPQQRQDKWRRLRKPDSAQLCLAPFAVPVYRSVYRTHGTRYESQFNYCNYHLPATSSGGATVRNVFEFLTKKSSPKED